MELLAAVDEAHETLSGSATRRILEREYQHYGKREYERLAYRLADVRAELFIPNVREQSGVYWLYTHLSAILNIARRRSSA